MRRQIAQEGKQCEGFSHKLLDGALKWDEKKTYPVIWNARDSAGAPVGWARDIRRESGGVITAEINITSEDLLEVADQVSFTIGGHNIKPDPLLRDVESVDLQYLFCVPKSKGHPW